MSNLEDTSIITIKKEKASIATYLIYIALFILTLALITSPFVFLKSIRSEYTLQQVQFLPSFKGFISIYPSLIANITFLACLLVILSKKNFKLSKLLFLLNITISIALYVYIYKLNFRVGISFFLVYLLNIIGFLLPAFYKLESITQETPSKKEEKESKKSDKATNLHKQKLFSKEYIAIIIVFIMLNISSLSVIIALNDIDIYKKTIKQVKSDFQIQVINKYINIRSAPNTESNIIGVVNKDDILNVIDIYSDDFFIWYEIDYKGKHAYIASDKKSPYIKELYKDKQIVNIFCSEKEEKCAYLLEFITRYSTTDKVNFVVNYLDIENKHNKETYDKLLKYFHDEETIPYLVIGNSRVKGYIKEENKEIVDIIKAEENSKSNLVDDIKKGKKLPKQPRNDIKK